MSEDFFMGIDLGTSSVRAVVFDTQGLPVLTKQQELTMITDRPNHVEFDPEEVLDHLIGVVRKTMTQLNKEGKALAGIGFSTQMHSLILTDNQGRPLTNVIAWADNRAHEQAESLKSQYDYKALYHKTGCILHHPLYPLSKILWFKKNEPEILKKAAHILTVKSYILYRLYNEYLIDYTDASAMGLFNLHTLEWDTDITQDILGISSSQLPKAVACDFLLRDMRSDMAETMQLDPSIPMAAGSGDGVLANLGCGIFDDQAMTSTIGTSGALRTTVFKPLLDDQLRTWCYCLTEDRWVAGGAITNGGIVLRWLRDQFRETFQKEVDERGSRNIYALFDEYARDLPAGSADLLFLPLLGGERSPNWNPHTRGVLFGLDLRHHKGHLVKAAMEGIMYQMYSVYQALAAVNQTANQIRANGGYARSDIWLQIQADLFNQPIAISNVNEASALGAAYLAMTGTGAVSSFNAGLPSMQVSRVIQPDPEKHAFYEKGYTKYIDTYDRLYR